MHYFALPLFKESINLAFNCWMFSFLCRCSYLVGLIRMKICCCFNCWIHIWLTEFMSLTIFTNWSSAHFVYRYCALLLLLLLLLLLMCFSKSANKLFIKFKKLLHITQWLSLHRQITRKRWNLLCCVYQMKLMFHNVSLFPCVLAHVQCKKRSFSQYKSNVNSIITDNESWNNASCPLSLPSDRFYLINVGFKGSCCASWHSM
jgi:hypothetical protein